MRGAKTAKYPYVSIAFHSTNKYYLQSKRHHTFLSQILKPKDQVPFNTIRPSFCVLHHSKYERWKKFKRRWGHGLGGGTKRERGIIAGSHPGKIPRNWAGGVGPLNDQNAFNIAKAVPYHYNLFTAQQLSNIFRRTSFSTGRRDMKDVFIMKTNFA